MKLITELVEDVEIKQLEEAHSPGKRCWMIEGVFMAASDPKRNIMEINRNKRSYRLDIVEREVNRYRQHYIKENRAWGELNHPTGPTINLDRVSHIIIELRQDGNLFYGKAKILETPCGLIAKSLLEGGGKLAVSSRGVGNLKEANGYYEVQEDFYLATPADIVADPSCSHAFVRGIMEGKDWVYIPGQGWVEEFAEQVKKVQDNTADKQLREDAALEAFRTYMLKLSEAYRV